jgi:hypothetical protein
LLFLLAKDQPSDTQFNIPVHIHLNNYFWHRNCLWILGHEPTLLDSKSIWSGLVKDV